MIYRIVQILRKGFVGLLLSLLSVATCFSQVLINEVCTNNAGSFPDEDGDFSDWIEILNSGSEVVDLSGFGLSDDEGDPMKWTFPGYSLQPGEHLVVFASGKERAGQPLYWNTVIRQGEPWKYIVPDENTSAGWIYQGYDDSSWAEGLSGFGYGDGDDATLLPNIRSVFLRSSFYLSDTSVIESLALHMDYDDGFIAYINGTEIARSNMGGNLYSDFATASREAGMYNGGKPEKFEITDPAGLLREGTNIIAVQVHNISEGSSDLSAIPFLSIKSADKPAMQPPVILGFSGTTFHTSFRLKSGGEYLSLSSPGILQDSLSIPDLGSDLSYGRLEQESGGWVVFASPTPGFPNTSEYYSGLITELPFFSIPGGMISDTVKIMLYSSDPLYGIYYTLDGSEPDLSSMQYDGSIRVWPGTVIRARIIKPGYIPGRIVSHTFFAHPQNKLPVICLSTDPDNLWDSEYGLYANGPGWQEEFPHFGANFWNDWERPVNVEMFEKSGQQAFEIDAGIKIFGNYSRGQPQKSLAIYARKKYGDGSIRYKIFGDKRVGEFESFVLRNSGNDWVGQDVWGGTMFRDLFMTRLAGEMGIDFMAGRQSVVYINGQYWGVMNIREKINEHFLASNHTMNPDNIDFLEGGGGVLKGSNEHYFRLLNFLSANDIRIQENYAWVGSQMDIQNFINYQLAEIYFFNGDWPGNNIKYWRSSSVSGKWKWIIFDTDFGFGMWDRNKVYENTFAYATETMGPEWPNPPWSTFLLRKMLENKQFRDRFINSFADRLNTTLLADSVLAGIHLLKEGIESEMQNHFNRWGGNAGDWNYQIETMELFGTQRPAIVRSQMEEFFGAGEQHNLQLSVSPENSGTIQLNSIMVRNFTWSGIYFENVPVRMTAIPKPGYRFRYWTGSKILAEPDIQIRLSDDDTLIANFEPIYIEWAFPVVINEIYFRSVEETGGGDWIELFNTSGEFIDLSGWILKDGDDQHSYYIRQGTILGPGAYLVICEDQFRFENAYPGMDESQGSFEFGFSGEGDMVRLYTEESILVDSVSYRGNSPWPFVPDGLSLALKDPQTDNSLPGSWGISKQVAGTPGSLNQLDATGIAAAGSEPADQLFHNSPNPFRDYTKINFYLNRDKNVRIEVYDLNGRLLARILDKRLQAGYHEIEWAPDQMVAGVLILKMQVPETTLFCKMLMADF